MKRASEEPCKSTNHKHRLSWWILSIVTALVVTGYFGWTLFVKSASAIQAEVHPLKVAKKILQQLSYVATISDWNIPFWDIGLWVLWLTGVLATGLILVSKSRIVHAISTSGALSLAFAVGFVILGLIQLTLGLVGLARFPLFFLYLLPVTCAFLYPASRELIRKCFSVIKSIWRHCAPASKLLVIVYGLVFIILMLPALTPPVQSDGVRYHLGAIQEYIKAGRIAYLPLNAYSNMPFLVEMHFMTALVCDAPVASQLIHATLAFFTAIGIYSLTRLLRQGSPVPSPVPHLIPSLLYLSIPVSAIIASWPFTDHGISFFLVTGLYGALVLRSEPTRDNLSGIIFGIIIGGLLGVKYTMFPTALILAIIPYISKVRSSRLLAVTLLTSALTGGIWIVKNVTFTGNPFYPLLSNVFPGGEWTTETNAFLHDKAGAKGIPLSIMTLLTSPLQLTFNWLNFEQHNPGVIFLTILPGILYFLIKKMSSQNRINILIVLLIGLFNYGVWFFSYQSNRLLLPVTAILLPLLALPNNLIPRLPQRVYITSLILASLMGMGWAYQWAFVTTGLTPAPLTYLTGQLDEKRFRYASLSYARAYDYLNTSVPPPEKVLLIGEHRIYGAKFSAVWSDWFDQPALAYIIRHNGITTLDQLLRYLECNQITWIMTNDHEISLQADIFRSRFTNDEWKIYEQLIAPAMDKYLKKTIAPGVRIYKLDKAGA